MHAAVLSAPGAAPVYRDHPEPVTTSDDEMVVEVLAAGLHHLTRARADGSHYSGSAGFPLVPGADGVVRDGSGRLRYAALDDTALGTFAERTVIDVRRSVVLPDGVDPVRIAAAMNPGMSSWVALRRRVAFVAGQRVLILGATGNAGRMAIQVARLSGAAHVIAAGRDEARVAPLTALGADETCTYDRIDRAADVDVVLDYVWGEPAAAAMIPMLTARADRGSPLTWIQIGSMAGPVAPIPSVALRSARFQIVGSGIGSVSARDIIAELPGLVAAVMGDAIDVRARALPLADVALAWTAGGEERIVLVP
jgi:NADPH:quinone reductase-like Zn-dependent oxidoreductase